MFIPGPSDQYRKVFLGAFLIDYFHNIEVTFLNNLRRKADPALFLHVNCDSIRTLSY
jgi:hypothetical protein